MGKLIDTDVLLANKFENPISYAAFCNLVKRQPSAQLEITRCKDCKRWRSFESGEFKLCQKIGGYWAADDFCSDAERREE